MKFYSRHGLGASPIIVDGLLVMPYDGSNRVDKAGDWPNNSTDEQLGLSFIPFTANAGTYKRAGSTITFSPTVAKHPRVMAGKPFTQTVRIKGDTLWASPSGLGAGAKWTWVRIER